MTERKKRFYFGCSYNLPRNPGGGAAFAQTIISILEDRLDAVCTSRWPWSEYHAGQNGGWDSPELGRSIATTDTMDLARADFAIIVLLTKTSRGAHVEMGMALASDKPCYLYRPNNDKTAFDELCLPLSDMIRSEIDRCIPEALKGRDHSRKRRPPR